jgi:hypothetical protein
MFWSLPNLFVYKFDWFCRPLILEWLVLVGVQFHHKCLCLWAIVVHVFLGLSVFEVCISCAWCNSQYKCSQIEYKCSQICVTSKFGGVTRIFIVTIKCQPFWDLIKKIQLGQRVLQHFLVLDCSAQPCTSGVVPLTTLQKLNKNTH